jgi:leucyl aminopeptidase
VFGNGEIFMKLSTKHEIIEKIKADILILGVFQKDSALSKFAHKVDKKISGLISDFVLKKEGFEGKFLDTYQLNNFQTDFGINKILIVGLGKKDEFSLDKLRELSAKIYKQCDNMANPKTVYCEVLGSQHFENKYIPCANAIAEGVLAGSYDFNKYKSKKNSSKIANFVLLAENEVKQTITNKIIKRAAIINNSLSFAKDLINEPAGVLTPSKVAQYAKEIADEHGLEINIYEKEELEKMGFGAFLPVGQGSDEPLKFIHLKYRPEEPKKSIALVGKGLTFDSGGLDIKPAASMLDMKDDMSGCACVLGVIKALAQLKVNVEVHVISAVCENMPSGRAYKPGDILKAKNGKTIEVDNTDAEGRLTLADAITYADELKVDEL